MEGQQSFQTTAPGISEEVWQRTMQTLLENVTQVATQAATQAAVQVAAQATAAPTAAPTIAARPRELKSQPPPVYTGNENELTLDTWLFSMREYLDEQADTERGIKIAGTYLGGSARSWWKGLVTHAHQLGEAPFADWNDFADAIRRHLCPGIAYPDEALIKLHLLRQGSRTITQYIVEFTELRILAEFNDERALRLFFISGLNSEAQFELKKAKVDTLQGAIELATQYEELQRQTRRQPRPPSKQPFVPANRQASFTSRNTGPAPMELDVIRQLSIKELAKLGRCFNCRDVGHLQEDCPLPAAGNDARQ